MNSVEPIRDYDMILNIGNYLKSKSIRNYVLFCFGIYVPIRISDILLLKVRDVKGRTQVSIREKKTGKEQKIPINQDLQKILSEYTSNMESYEFLFPSRQSSGKKNTQKALSRQQAYNILNEAARHFGLNSIGCHTMRKTFGYHFYQQTKDIMKLQAIYNHPDPNTTKLYIGLVQDMKDNAIMTFKYRKL